MKVQILRAVKKKVKKKSYLFNLVVVESQVFEAAGEVRGDTGQVIVLQV